MQANVVQVQFQIRQNPLQYAYEEGGIYIKEFITTYFYRILTYKWICLRAVKKKQLACTYEGTMVFRMVCLQIVCIHIAMLGKGEHSKCPPLIWFRHSFDKCIFHCSTIRKMHLTRCYHGQLFLPLSKPYCQLLTFMVKGGALSFVTIVKFAR